MSPPRLNLLVLRSAAPERLAAFYEGLGLRFERHRHGSGPEHYAAQAGEAVFEIYPLGDADETPTLPRLGFTVDALPEALAAAEANGGSLAAPAKPSPWGFRAVVSDPDGRKVELVESPCKL